MGQDRSFSCRPVSLDRSTPPNGKRLAVDSTEVCGRSSIILKDFFDVKFVILHTYFVILYQISVLPHETGTMGLVRIFVLRIGLFGKPLYERFFYYMRYYDKK